MPARARADSRIVTAGPERPVESISKYFSAADPPTGHTLVCPLVGYSVR